MSVSLKILESNRQIENLINQSLALQLNSKIRSNNKKVTNNIKLMIPTWITEQKEVASLLAQGVQSSLNAEFGLPPGLPEVSVAAIIRSVADSISVEIPKLDKHLKGSVLFRIQSEDFSNLLGLPEGFVTTHIGSNLHWLNWILTMGGTPVITGYQYIPNNLGRSGGGQMTGGKVWRVPSEHSGTIDNNFITRALENREKEITNALRGLFI